MPYVLGERLAEITVLENGDSLGRVTRGCLPEWFWPDIEVDTRTRRLIKTRIMICLADTEPEAAGTGAGRARRTTRRSASALAFRRAARTQQTSATTHAGTLPELEGVPRVAAPARAGLDRQAARLASRAPSPGVVGRAAGGTMAPRAVDRFPRPYARHNGDGSDTASPEENFQDLLAALLPADINKP